jgi:hypothetical protein
MQSLLYRNKKPSCKWNFFQPLPSQHLENDSAKYESIACKFLILSKQKFFASNWDNKAWRRDKASTKILSFPFLYLTM